MPDQPPPLILVVDGDAATREATARTLRRAGYRVTEAGTGREALRVASTGPSLVILDFQLPDVGGYEVCRRLKADPATAAIPLLETSAPPEDVQQQAQGLDGGADACLTDATEPTVLLATVRALLRMRRAEESAQAAARAWQATFDAIGDGVFLLDPSGRVLRCNAALAAIVGRSAADLVGRPADALLPTWPVGGADSPLARCLAARTRVTTDLRTDDRWYRLTADPVRTADGALAGAVGILADVTERRRAEADRRATAEQFRVLVESVRDYAIFRIDASGRTTTWNEGVRRVLGFDEAEFVGSDVRRLFTAEDAAAGVAEAEMRQATAKGAASDDRWMARKDGTRFWASGTMNAVRDEGGTVVGFTKVMRDITDRKEAEERLKEADRRKDEFLAMLGHELRNPLAPIRNALFLMKLRGSRDPGDAERLRAMMDRQISHIARLVDDLLDVSRITQGKFELRTESTDLREVLANALDGVQSFLDERQHILDIDLPAEPVKLRGDPVRLEQVFANLLHNAAKYTEPGGRVRLAAAVEGSEAVVRVRDSGIGIRPDIAGKIFDMFTQGDRVSGRLKEGLGLGLTLVKTLVQMHGGTVSVASDGPGRGSEFTVRLPLPAADAAAPAGPGQSPPIAEQRLRVLVVDDNVDAADSLRMVLEAHCGHQVRVAYDGEAGLAAAREFRPDVALLDIALPKGLDGYEVARRLRATPGLDGIKLVALTGYGRPEDRERSTEAGFTAHLVKPVEPKELGEVLARCPPV
jgi:PAS domain S-box-containing protein